MYRIQVQDAYSDLKLLLSEPQDMTRLQDASDQLKKRELQRLITACTSESNHLKAALLKINEGRQQMAEVSRRATSAARTAAENELRELEAELDTAVIEQAKLRLRVLEKLKLSLLLESDQIEVKLAQTAPPPAQNANNIQLPTIHLEKFSGNRSRWYEFFENYSSAVHNTAMAKTQKMTYLRTLLVDDARKVIEGLTLTDANYDIAMDLLKKKYDNKSETIEVLFNNISALKQCRTFEDCKQFAERLERLCRQLEALGQSVNSPAIYLALEQKLTETIRREVFRVKEASQTWNTDALRTTLDQVLRSEESFQHSSRSVVHDTSRNSGYRTWQKELHKPDEHVTLAVTENKRFPSCPKQLFNNKKSAPDRNYKCQLCDKSHRAEDCKEYQSGQKRYLRIKELKRCFRCLGASHAASGCKSTITCVHCKKQHHPALCYKEYGATITTTTTASAPTLRDQALLMSAQATVTHPEVPIKTKAIVFFDTGSHLSYITKDTAQKLKLPVIREERVNLCTFGAEQPTEHVSQIVEATTVANNGKLMRLQMGVVNSIIPRDIPLAIINEDEESVRGKGIAKKEKKIVDSRPDILIGIDQVHLFQITTRMQTREGYTVSDSILGPILSGKGTSLGQKTNPSAALLLVSTSHRKANDENELFQVVQQHYDLEKVGTDEDLHNDEDTEVLEAFNKSLVWGEGRYQVSLPWKVPRPELDSNYGLARGRLWSTMKMLKKSPELLEQYDKIMREQLEKGIIEMVSQQDINKSPVAHYLPHQAVVREEKLHTKLRIVYDGSAKTRKNGNSINQCLHRGPLLLCDLVGVLLRFRLPEVCIVADIEKAFLQLSIKPEDRDACRFLWPENPFTEDWANYVATYRFKRVTFGLICSPFLLAATVKEHLRRENSVLAKNMMENVYVDNILIHLNESQRTLETCLEAKAIFAKAAMNLREFASNDTAAIAQLRAEDQVPNKIVKVLGINWDTEKDVFRIRIRFQDDKVETKRTVLKKIAAAFDPLGWMTPAMLSAKQFFQELWKLKMAWDDQISEEMTKVWKKIGATWNHETIIPRRLFEQPSSEVELHIFADASKDAFGAVAYLKSHPEARLIYSKCRVKSLQSKATIPKLELQALKMAAQIAQFLENVMPSPAPFVSLPQQLTPPRGRCRLQKASVETEI